MAVSGTLKLHAAVPINETTLATRENSCNCENCLSNVKTTDCAGWTVHSLFKKDKRARTSTSAVDKLRLFEEDTSSLVSDNRVEPEAQDSVISSPSKMPTDSIIPEIPTTDLGQHQTSDALLLMAQNGWVAAVYNDDWYIGKVTEIDTDEVHVQINFLTNTGKYRSSYRFPNIRDEIWVNKKDVLLILQKFTTIGKTKRCFKLCPNELSKKR